MAPPRKHLLWTLALVVLVPVLWTCYKVCMTPSDAHDVGCAMSLLPSHENVCSSGPGMDEASGGGGGSGSGSPFGL